MSVNAELVALMGPQLEVLLPVLDEKSRRLALGAVALAAGDGGIGAVASVLDSACGYAAFSMMPPDAAVLTASYTINLLAPAAGERFTITGEVVRAGRTLVVCRGEAFADGDKRPFAIMQATMTALSGRPGLSG